MSEFCSQKAPIISIIIPVYNVDLYLDSCLESVVQQKYKNIEIICINDGSTDNSLEILKKWKEKDKRIKVLNQTNQGVSVARNSGLKIATGKYISFVDADDIVCNNIYTTSIPIITKYNLDAYIFSFKTFPNGYIETTGFKTNTLLNYKELLTSNKKIQTKNSLCFNWRFIFLKSVLIENQIFFNKGIAIGEDMIYNVEAICHSKRIMVTDKVLYLHRMDNKNSAMSAKYKPQLDNSLYQMYEIKKKQIKKYNLDKYSPYSYDLACYTILVYLPMMIKNVYNAPENNDKEQEIKKILSSSLCKDAFKTIGYDNIFHSWKEYIFYIILKFRYIKFIGRYYNNQFNNNIK